MRLSRQLHPSALHRSFGCLRFEGGVTSFTVLTGNAPCCAVLLALLLLSPQIVRMLERINIYEVLPRKWVFVHTHDGVRAALAALDDGENGFAAQHNGAGKVTLVGRDQRESKDVDDAPEPGHAK